LSKFGKRPQFLSEQTEKSSFCAVFFLRATSIENLRYYLECKDDFLNVEVKEGEQAVAVDENGRIAAAGDYTEVSPL
jgi:hypothetical protein